MRLQFACHDKEHVQRFECIVEKIMKEWPSACPDNPEWDLLLKAAKEAFHPEGRVHHAIEALYVKQALLRPLVDMMAASFSDQFCRKYTE